MVSSPWSGQALHCFGDINGFLARMEYFWLLSLQNPICGMLNDQKPMQYGACRMQIQIFFPFLLLQALEAIGQVMQLLRVVFSPRIAYIHTVFKYEAQIIRHSASIILIQRPFFEHGRCLNWVLHNWEFDSCADDTAFFFRLCVVHC